MGHQTIPEKFFTIRKITQELIRIPLLFGTGITLNFSIPLDRQLGKLCKDAASTQIGIQKQKLKNLELEWHVARVKHCGELMQKGIRVKEGTIFHSVCSDVFLTPRPNQIEKHYHSFSIPEKK